MSIWSIQNHRITDGPAGSPLLAADTFGFFGFIASVGLDPNLAGTLEQWAHLLAKARDLIDLTAAYQGFDRFPLGLDLVQ